MISFDFLLDSEFRVWLLDVETQVDLSLFGDEFDNGINQIVTDTLNLVGVPVVDHMERSTEKRKVVKQKSEKSF